MSRIVARAETWEKAYQAFSNINFAAFDYDTIKQSLVDYIKLYFAESFNDFIESSELIVIIECFAYIAELLAYRMDVNAHENFITTAQRKDSILRLAKLVSYTPARPIPARGLVKITSVSTTETVYDANNNNLANVVVTWDDPTNTLWKDQFLTVINRVTDQPFGSVGPADRFQIQDVLFEVYNWNVVTPQNGVFQYNATVSGSSVPMELVPVGYSGTSGIVERRPSLPSQFSVLYGQDGQGDNSSTTGFFCFTKQGTLQRVRTTFDGVTPNQTYTVSTSNINDTDVWLNNVDASTGATLDTITTTKTVSSGKTGEWVQVDLAHAQNVIFNTNPNRSKYEVETLANNQIRLIFGDGEFADIPKGSFDIWVRTSQDIDNAISKSAVSGTSQQMSYVDSNGRTQTLTITFSLINTLQNGSASEDMEHVRVAAPSVYYSQDRMVNGKDYNSFMLQDPSILKLRSIVRTFAGDSNYVAWHDPTGSYENVKMLGTDGVLYLLDEPVSVTTPRVEIAALISAYIEPVLSTTGMFLQLACENIDVNDYRRVFSPAEVAAITSALTPPPQPVSCSLYFNKDTNVWYPVLSSSTPPATLAPYGWPTSFIPSPLLTITQQTASDTTYVVSYVSRKFVFESQNIAFWNVNEQPIVQDYDSQRTSSDIISLLPANIDASRTGVLPAELQLNILAQQLVSVGTDTGTEDIHRLNVLPKDNNGDRVPDGVNLANAFLTTGLASVVNPKIVVNLSNVTVPIGGIVVNSPIGFIIDRTTSTTSDVEVYASSGQRLTQGIDWVVGDVSVGQHVSTTVKLLRSGTSTSLGSSVNVSSVSIIVREYVYFMQMSTTTAPYALPSTIDNITSYEESVFNADGVWSRKMGRASLNFMWMHYSVDHHLIDPSPSNIIDGILITRGYFTALKRWLEDQTQPKPTLPTPLDLRTSYGYMLDNGMVSDTFVLRPGRIKLLFGRNAAQQVRATLKVVRTSRTELTDSQIKSVIVTTVRNFFDITQWEFGETFYFTQLASAIHSALPIDISSVVLVPTFQTNQFGDLFQIQAREDEVLYPDISISDIEMVQTLSSTVLRQ